MSSQVSGGGFTFSLQSQCCGLWYWTVQSINNRIHGQQFQIVDIKTPFGPFDVVSSPIPGDVVVAMADSIIQFQQQVAPQLFVSSPLSYSLSVVEGGATLEAAIVSILNSGAFGSSLNVTATPDSPWISVSPSNIIGLNKNDSGQFKAYVKPSLMLASSSPYTGHINLQDNRNPPTIIPLTFEVIVLPRPSILLSATVISLSWYLSTSSTFGPQTLRVTNSGPVNSNLYFSVAKLQNMSPWLSFVPASAGPIPTSGFVDVTFSLIGTSVPAIPGVYTELIRISSPTASNSPQDVTVQLTVNP